MSSQVEIRSWTRIPLRRNYIEPGPSGPTASGLAEVRYTYDEQQGRITSLTITADCTETEEDALGDLLFAYLGAGLISGMDPVCMHDAALHDGRHDIRCWLVAWDQLASALEVEVQAILAESDV